MEKFVLKITTALAVLAVAVPMRAQVYYTDSDVRDRTVSIAPFIQANTVFRRAAAEVVGEQPEVTDVFRGGFGGAYGLSVNAHVKPFRLGFDAAQSNFSYRQGVDRDNLLRTKSHYLMLRGRIGFATQMNDETTLEVWVPLAYRMLQSVERDGASGNVSESMTSAGIEIGSSIKLSEHWGWFGLVGLDNAFGEFEATPTTAYREYPLWVTLSTGVRYAL
ncbi:MAG: hypothetical protein RL206_938 [Bacteroidota bacterium]|jgi:hypothetical protein